MVSRRIFKFLLVLSGCIVLPLAAKADSWAMPEVTTYTSADSHVRFTATPRDISSPLDYFEGKVKNDPKAGQLPGSPQTMPTGRLERKDASGHWVTVWNKPLVNDVSPVSALVTNSGRYVVTFDDWHSMGFGDNVVVIYGPDGTPIRALSLNDILPDYYIKALPRTVSSLWWSGKHRISENDERVILEIVVPGDETGPFDEDRKFAELPINLAIGQVLTPDTDAWKTALAEAQKVAKLRQAQEEARDKWFREPLVAPASTSEPDWHQYLVEAFFRIDTGEKSGFPSTHILRDPKASDYAPSVEWLREALLEREVDGDVIMIASPASPENLISVLTQIVPHAKAGAWKGRRLYVAVPAEYRDRIAAILAPTGAEFIHLDPAKPIPQRPERLKDAGL